MKKIIAVDFDGVLCTDVYPKIGKPDYDMINELIYRRKNGDKLILWTCRRGIYLAQAVKWCKNKGLEFDAINKNLPESIEIYNGDTRKVFADIYIDDKSDYMVHLDKNFGDPLTEKEYDKIDHKFKDNGYERVYPMAATFSYEKYIVENNYIHRIDIFINYPNNTYFVKSYQKSKKNSILAYSVSLCDWQIELTKQKVDDYLLTANKLETKTIWCDNKFGFGEFLKTGIIRKYHRKYPNLCKIKYPWGEIKYTDTTRVIEVDIHSGCSNSSKFIREKIVDVIYPITMPYKPNPLEKPFKVYTESFSIYNNTGNGYYSVNVCDTKQILYLIKPDGTKIELNQHYKFVHDVGWKKISKFEYLIRKFKSNVKGN